MPEPTATQLSLVPAAHSFDPVTSYEAEAEVTRSGQRSTNARRVLELVKDHPGLCSKELATLCYLDRHEVARRLADLKALGYVEQGPAVIYQGRKHMTWRTR